MTGWEDVWERRTLPAEGSLLARLMAADGLDALWSATPEQAWREFVGRTADRLGLRPGDSVHEVGCGAGAFLLPLAERGLRVSGVDRSRTLVGYARAALPAARLEVGDARALAPTPAADAVVSMGLLLYLASLDEAAAVLRRMAARARRAVAVLDLPDLAHREAALAHRTALAGGPAAYAERYAGLEHQHYDRAWVADALTACGLTGVTVADQDLAGYGNAAHRFNAWGFVP